MWPAGDSLFTNCLLGSLKTVGWRGPSASLGIQRLEWLRRVIEELSATKCIGSNSLHLRYRRDCISGFALLRLGGLDLTAAAVISSPTTLSSRNDWRENCVRDILHGFFQTADAVPSLLTAVAALSVSPAFFKQPLLEQAEYMSQLQSMQNCFPLTHTSIGSFYEESGMSEAQVDEANFRRILASSGSSLGSYQVLQGVQVVQHSIDRPMLSSFYPLDAPWSVEFRDVSFRYSERHPYVLRHVSFFVDRGQFFGITGYSGAGKTTILRLLNRTYAPTTGDIFINGVSVGKYPARMLRRGIANVWQEENGMRLFEGLSIATNVALGNLGASTENNVISALSASQSLSFVQNRSLGIHTPLRTDELSGGEVERLCIARAFMKYHSNAGLCTFDEPTSAVDAVTEEMIYNSLQLRGKESKIRTSTIIVAAHRLATLRDADKIIVLNEGSVAECGTWVELRRKGTQSGFSKMLDSQLVLFSMT
uniref:WGS project CAEQ00000000 data, annotated contig 709 n=1 Tax=Trypanosoma congolense (strain IL3000) TaxID=1068625 RepID=F9WHZ0_TRYCI|nr:unnamed protein product [Trypanosoma congolense IL3000]